MNNNFCNCNYNDNYEKIKKRIEEESKKYKMCYIQGPTGPRGDIGPTGPKGEDGPTTIEVGTTETGEPNTEAIVKNVGTNKNVILNFVIPKGVTRIGGHAFYGCSNLSYVIVPSTVVEIGSSAFRQCTSLRSIHVPKNAVINERAFKESPTSVIYY